MVNDYTSTVGKYDASTGATINANFITGMQGISMIADATATPEPATNVVFCPASPPWRDTAGFRLAPNGPRVRRDAKRGT